MKKFTKFVLRLIAVGAAIGGIFAYLKKKGYITVSTDNEDEDYDDFSSIDTEGNERTYINVDTEAMKSKAKEVAQDAYDDAKEKVKDASKNIANVLEKAWYEAENTMENTVEKVEEFFNDEE